MATVNPYSQKPHPETHEWENFLWQTAEEGGDGVANGDTVTMLEMKLTYIDCFVQLLNTVPASTTVALVGGITNDAAKAQPLLDSSGTAITLTTENQLVHVPQIPPYVGFTVSGGTAGDMDVHLSRRYAG